MSRGRAAPHPGIIPVAARHRINSHSKLRCSILKPLIGKRGRFSIVKSNNSELQPKFDLQGRRRYNGGGKDSARKVNKHDCKRGSRCGCINSKILCIIAHQNALFGANHNHLLCHSHCDNFAVAHHACLRWTTASSMASSPNLLASIFERTALLFLQPYRKLHSFAGILPRCRHRIRMGTRP